MDRSADGGMAPALQSSNHQSTSLAKEEEVTQNKSVLPHDKVNGNKLESDTCLEECCSNTETQTTEAGAAHGKGPEDVPGELKQDPQSDACVLSGMKEVLPDINMPALHIGQGDSAVGNVGNYNGWSDRKKSFIGSILQQSDNLTSLHSGNKMMLKKSVYEKNNSTDCREEHGCENLMNGKVLKSQFERNGHSNSSEKLNLTSDGSYGYNEEKLMHDTDKPPAKQLECSDKSMSDTENQECLRPSAAVATGDTMLDSALSEDKVVGASNLPHNDRQLDGRSPSHHQTHVISSSPERSDTSKIVLVGERAINYQTVEHDVKGESQSSVSELCNNETMTTGKNAKSEASIDHTNEDVSVNKLPSSTQQTFNYSQLLTGGLSSVNMSDKLANTLQELAASLKGSSFPLEMNGAPDQLDTCESNHTVKSEGVVNTLRKSVKSLNFSVSEKDDTSDQETRVKCKIQAVTQHARILEHRLSLLKHNLYQLRSRTVKHHVNKEMSQVAAHLPRHDWENMPVDVTDTETIRPTVDFWQKVLEDNANSCAKRFSRDYPFEKTDRHSKDSINTASHESESAGKKEKSDTLPERKMSDDLDGIDIDPIVPLTRIDHVHTSTQPDTHKLADLARTNVGVLKKELRYALSCCDPELTESSSDEDIKEAYEDRAQKTKSKSKVKPRIARYRKSFCRWVAERAEISRRWTWLQSRISRLEFDIRHQGDLYNQLRENKGTVHLVTSERPSLPGNMENAELMTPSTSSNCTAMETQSSLDQSPCNIDLVLDNVNHQASRLFDKLSPVSGGWPSPVQHVGKNSESSSCSSASSSNCSTLQPLDMAETCARTRQLRLDLFKTRKLIKTNQKSLMSNKSLASATVPNDSSIMCMEITDSSLHENEDYSSLILKAAVHDHSYHAAISSLKDIPLSISARAVMKSKHKWLKKSSPRRKDQAKRNVKKLKRKSEKKSRRSPLPLSANHLADVESKRRKLTSQLSETSNKRRSHGGSFDPDSDSPVIVGGFNSHQPAGITASGATTPTSEMTSQSQFHWKKKKTTEQAFDINNIVIPHGLNSSRIEKLVYKEIQTPSWKVLQVCQRADECGSNEVKEEEDTSNAAFQSRHDTFEIAEKRKYVAFMEWNKSQRGRSRGSRMGNIRGPTTLEPVSPPSVGGDAANSMPFTGEPFSSTFSATAQAIATSPTAKPSTTSRHISVDQTSGRPGSPAPQALPLNQRNTDTSLPASCPSPSMLSWQDSYGSGRNSQEYPAHVNSRTPSNGGNRTDDVQFEGWDTRSFPLSEDDVRLLDDIEYAKMKLRNSGHIISRSDSLHYRIHEGEYDAKNSFSRQPSTEKTAAEGMRSGSFEGSKDTVKSSMAKRRRTDSRASSLASYDDSARHSDASTASVSSSRRKKKKESYYGRPGIVGQQRSTTGGKGPLRTLASSRKSKQKYMHLRLSETDDTSSDSDTDSNSSDEDSLLSSDDAGHVVDDYADPEWEAPIPRQRDRR